MHGLPPRTAFDDRLILRAAALTAMTVALVVGVTALTDEGNVPWALRVSRSLPALPLAAAVGAGLTFRTARLRGEVRALAALGRSPRATGAFAAGGAGVVVAAVALAVLAVPAVDVSGFFPSAYAGEVLVPDGPAYRESTGRFRVEADGSLTYPASSPGPSANTAPPPGPAVPRGGRGAAALALLAAGVALAQLAARARWSPSDTGATALFLAASALLFHAAALGHVPAFTAAAPAMALLAWASLGYGRGDDLAEG